MGTNYYAQVDYCAECGRVDELHIGKNGSMLAAHEDRNIRSWQDWKRWLTENGETVRDEYGRIFTLGELVAIFESTSADKRRRQYDWEQQNGYYSGRSWLDADGYTVTPGEWS